MNQLSNAATIIRQCAWCETLLGFPSRVASLINQPHIVSHGICWDCQKKQLAILSKKARMHHEVKNQAENEVQMEKAACSY